jgi:hypothetical protein
MEAAGGMEGRMSVEAVRKLRGSLREFQQEVRDSASAVVMPANPVWGACETVNAIAAFDTEEAARAYERLSRLPETVRTPDGITRTYRPDSLLYDYNPPHGEEAAHRVPWLVKMVPWVDYGDIRENPAPPVGPVPEMRTYDGPRYGRDYDVGYGGPYSDMNHVKPGEVPMVPTPEDAEREQRLRERLVGLVEELAVGGAGEEDKP